MTAKTINPAPTRDGNAGELTQERNDLLETLGKHRFLLRFTARGLSDEQARTRTTASALTVGGLIKHVTAVERQWAAFIGHGAGAMASSGAEFTEADADAWAGQFELGPAESLESALGAYQAVADRTDELIRTLPDLDTGHTLPSAPWFEPGATWSHRRVLLHIVAETAQHAGHADIVRESLDGAKTMG